MKKEGYVIKLTSSPTLITITEAAISKLFARTAAELQDNIGLRKDIEKLEETIGV